MSSARRMLLPLFGLMGAACGRAPDASPTVCPPCPTCAAPPPSASASAPPAASASASAPRKEPASEDEDLYCKKGNPSGQGEWKPRFGQWDATAEEVFAAAKKIKFVCAATDWLPEALLQCMQRLGQVNVVVRYGVMDGERATPVSCDIEVGTAEWKGRKWVSLYSSVRQGATFLGYGTSVEKAKSGWVVATEGCQLYQGEMIGNAKAVEPKGWKTFPEELKHQLCP